MSTTTSFVKQTIPEFVKRDNPMFIAFIEAYYEFLEKKNTGTVTSKKDVYKNLYNAGAIVNKNEIYLDVDETVDEFVTFFEQEVLPIAIDEIQTNPRFFIKKIRELYLAKGTVKSFELFFKLFFNKQIEVVETGDTLLKTSDGKYFNFPAAHFYIEDYESELENIELTLSTLYDSDVILDTVLNGLVVGRTDSDSAIVRILLSSDTTTIDKNKSYLLRDNNGYTLKLKPLLAISNISVKEGGSLYEPTDTVYLESNSFKRNFLASIDGVDNGNVEKIAIRSRGVNYNQGDVYEFTDGVNRLGDFEITDVDTIGEIQKINDLDIRGGFQNRGFISGTLEDVRIPVVNGGSWNVLPNTVYKPKSDPFKIDIGLPYKKIETTGTGFQTLPISKTIGKVNSISLNQYTYFKDSDDLNIKVPSTIAVENLTNINVGDTIAFQTFVDKTEGVYPLVDDSEKVTMIFTFEEHFSSSDSDSEFHRVETISLPYAFDSETFTWQTQDVTFDSFDVDVLQPLKDLLLNSNISYEIETQYGLDNYLDGGDGFGAVQDSDADGGIYSIFEQVSADIIDGGEPYAALQLDSEIDAGASYSGTYGDSDDILDAGLYDAVLGGYSVIRLLDEGNRPIDGGNTFDFGRSEVNKAVVTFEGAYLSNLEEQHFDDLGSNDYHDYGSTLETNNNVLGKQLISVTDSENSSWVDIGYYGKVVKLGSNNNVIEAIAVDSNGLPTDSELDNISLDKYKIIKISTVDDFGVSRKDYSLPLTNVVHQIDSFELDYKLDTVSNIFKRFYSQDGFLSSSYGGTLQDGNFYSNYSYRIKTTIPYENWKEKFKTLLHPAGMVLTAELTYDSPTSANGTSVQMGYEKKIDTSLTFDKQQEYRRIETVQHLVSADSVTYGSNAFEIKNFNEINDASYVKASNQTVIPGYANKQQNGSAFWDYEPVGLVKKELSSGFVNGTYVNFDSDLHFLDSTTTQDSDGNGYVKNESKFYKPFSNTLQDSFKSNKRLGKDYRKILTSKVQFEDATFASYDVWDSDLTPEQFSTFVDSDAVFKSIDYDKLFPDSDTRTFKSYNTERVFEIVLKKEKDFVTAMKENKELVYQDSEGVWYDYQAWDKLWNSINVDRNRNDEGWSIQGSISYLQNDLVKRKNNKRGMPTLMNEYNPSYIKSNLPYDKFAWNQGTLVWNNYYETQINKLNVESINEDTYKDPTKSMKGRRKW